MLAALDLNTDKITYRIRERKRWREFLAFLKLLRARWPAPNRIRRLAVLPLGGTDHHTHAWQGEMISAYVRWRNARAQPTTGFAPNSVIRTWTDYQTNVA
jgi:hypothetical protein